MRAKILARGWTLTSISLLLLGCSTAASASEPALQSAETTLAQVQDNSPPPVDQPASTEPQANSPEPGPSKDKWEFATIGYVWFAGAWGKTDVIGPAEPVDLSLPFGKVLKAFKFAFMGAAEARHDRTIILGDLTFIHLDTKEGIGIRDPDFLTAELDSRTAEVTLLGGYRVVNDGPVSVDLLAGGRMNFFKTTLQLDGPNRSLEGSKSESWFDPLIAARLHAPLGGKWRFSAYGDLGGIVMGSDITWQAVATVDYQISRKMTVGAGWRHYKVNYDHGDFLYNTYQTGPLIVFRTVL